jgi:hypothetical protein
MSFTTLASTDFVVSSDSVVSTAWSTNSPTLTNFYTSSTAHNYNQFYLNVYDVNPDTNSSALVQFSIAYGNVNGSGSQLYNPLVSTNSPSRTTYGQYRSLVYADETALFNFGTGCSASFDMIALNVDRNRYKESLYLPTFNLQVKDSSGNTIYLTNDSVSTQYSPVNYLDCGRVYNVLSGSNGTPTTSAFPGYTAAYTPSGSYGLFLPDIGTIILNPRALSLPFVSGGVSLNWDLSSNPTLPSSSLNNLRMWASIQSGSCFQLNSQETVSANYVFVRVSNGAYNYTANPTFTSGSSGQLIYPTLINSPQTFPTTVGLYNDNNDLLAVAKLSRPLLKDFTKEALIRVKMDW